MADTGRTWRAWCRDAAAVSPVVGTVLILAITILGVAGVLFWGAPTIQGIQDRNAQNAMAGEFLELRRDTLDLTIPDASRVPAIALSDGTFSVTDGSRMQVTANHDGGNGACDFHVTGWQTPPVGTLQVDASGCRPLATSCPGGADGCLEVHKVLGSKTVNQTITVTPTGTDAYDVDVDSGDLTTGDWMFRITDGNAQQTEVYAQAWLLTTQRLSWELQSGVSDLGIHLEGGAVFRSQAGSIFLERGPRVEEAASGSDDYVVRLPMYTGDEGSISGSRSFHLFLRLQGNHVRIQEEAATLVRYDFDGDLAEAWCNVLLDRNDRFDAGPRYQADPADGCEAAVPSISYVADETAHPVDEDADPDDRPAFPFEFIHGRVQTNLQL